MTTTSPVDRAKLGAARLELRKAMFHALYGRPDISPTDCTADGIIDGDDHVSYFGMTHDVWLADLVALDGGWLHIESIDGDAYDAGSDAAFGGAVVVASVDGHRFRLRVHEYVNDPDYTDDVARITVETEPPRVSHRGTFGGAR